VKNDVKRWLKIVLLLGIVTIFLTPYDADSGPLPALTEATAVQEAIAGIPISVSSAQAKPRTKKRIVGAPAAAHTYSARNLSIIDVTCARLC
jgi:hypothetical protein